MRAWNELVAAWGDVFSLPLTVVVLLLAALLTGALWYFWPRWWHALKRVRWRRRERRERKAGKVRAVTDEELAALEASEEELPEVEAAVFATLADRYAAEGRYAEAVRERLRAMVRELVVRGVVANRPGWTVTELADASKSTPVTSAANIFSLIWYGKRPALSEHDARMRELADELRREVSRR